MSPQDYLRRRERQERAAAQAAASPTIASLHLQMAEHFASQLRKERQLRPPLRLVD